MAAREFFSGKNLDIVEKMTFEDVLDSVVDYESDYGMFAIENGGSEQPNSGVWPACPELHDAVASTWARI